MYQGRTFIRESVYVCGNYMDADIYPVFQKPCLLYTSDAADE